LKIVRNVLVIVICVGAGFVAGIEWQHIRDYEAYVYPFSLYSRHLNGLAQSGNSAKLTNDAILLYERFNSRLDARDLQDVVGQICRSDLTNNTQ